MTGSVLREIIPPNLAETERVVDDAKGIHREGGVGLQGGGGGKCWKKRKKWGLEGVKCRKRADLGGGRVAGGEWVML